MDQELIAKLYRNMLLIRRFEEELAEAVPAKPARSRASHKGHEALAVGAASVLEESDLVISAHGGLGIFIARCASLQEALSAFLGKPAGTHTFFSPERKFFTGLPEAFSLPLSAGLAAAQPRSKDKTVAVCFFTEKALTSGLFHEALILGSLWRLPLVFVLEHEDEEAERDGEEPGLAALAEAFGFSVESIDGRDIFAVRAAVHSAATRARETGSAALVAAYIGGAAADSRSGTPQDPVSSLAAKLDGLHMREIRERIEGEVDREIEKVRGLLTAGGKHCGDAGR